MSSEEKGDEKRTKRSGLPVDEIGQQGEPRLGTLLRMTLDSEDIIPRNRAGKGDTVIRHSRDAIAIDRIDVITVHEIQPGAVVNVIPEGV